MPIRALPFSALLAATLALALTGTTSHAQDTLVTACASAPHRAFDFWIGQWHVTDSAGTVVGTNTITRVLGGCALHEQWHGVDGSRGNSYSMYDNATRQWHQHWTDIGGNLLRLSGTAVNGSIVLDGENITPAGRAQSRVTWSRLSDGRVRQHWQLSTDSARTWRTHFDGYYRSATSVGDVSVKAADVLTIDATIAALYASISGAKGIARDWPRFRSLFAPEARLMSTWRRADGTWTSATWTPEQYIATANATLLREGFFETETARRTERFGNIAQLFSTYESRANADDRDPFQRGINSIQLRHDGTRWMIVSVLWEAESPAHPIPPQFASPASIAGLSQRELLTLASPGPEHLRLASLAGSWRVESGSTNPVHTHTARATMIVGGRFLELELGPPSGSPGAATQRYSIGFDRRHGRYVLTAMDTAGTYAVTSVGVERDGIIHLDGEDEDPVMRRMGFTKKFAHQLQIVNANEFILRVFFVDTRTPAERAMLAAQYRFTRMP